MTLAANQDVRNVTGTVADKTPATDLAATNAKIDAAKASADAAARPSDVTAARDHIEAHGDSAWGAAVEIPAGYTRVTSDTYGTLLPGTVIDAYAASDTTYATPLVPNALVASNGTWAIYLPDAGSYVLVGRLAQHSGTGQAVTT